MGKHGKTLVLISFRRSRLRTDLTYLSGEDPSQHDHNGRDLLCHAVWHRQGTSAAIHSFTKRRILCRYHRGGIFCRRDRQSYIASLGVGLLRKPFQSVGTNLSALYISLVSSVCTSDAVCNSPLYQNREFVNFSKGLPFSCELCYNV